MPTSMPTHGRKDQVETYKANPLHHVKYND